MRVWLNCLILLLCSNLFGQHAHPFLFSDTIKADHRIGGSLDSIDLMFRTNSSTLPGGGHGVTENLLPTNWLSVYPSGQRFYSFSQWNPYRYSGIPHVGFAYCFGSQGTQLVSAKYEQGFSGNIMLNIDFKKERSNGYLRNSNFDHNDVQLKLFKKGNIYSADLKSSFEKSTVSHNGGISVDSIADEFSLIFIPVEKESSEIKTQRSRVELVNYLDLNKDSVKAFGAYTSHDLKTKHYRYLENGNLSGVYPVINFDSSSTYDQHQWSQFGNGLGLFTKGRRQLVKAGITAQFWNFQNLGNYFDTVEVDLTGAYQWSSKDLVVKNELELNLIGAQQEMSSRLDLVYSLGALDLNGEVLYRNVLPDYYQRFAFGNNYYPANIIEKQKLADLEIGAEYGIGKHVVKLDYEFVNAADNYWFLDSIWRNDTLNAVNYQSFKIGGILKAGAWTFTPVYSFTLNDNSLKIIPAHQVKVRIHVKGGLFKAKRMIGYAGVELSAFSAFSRIGFNAVNSTLGFNEITASQNGWSNLHLFTGFQIEEFKFYLRVENLGYFWNEPNSEIMNGYPIPSTQFRLGLTWDFFN